MRVDGGVGSVNGAGHVAHAGAWRVPRSDESVCVCIACECRDVCVCEGCAYMCVSERERACADVV